MIKIQMVFKMVSVNSDGFQKYGFRISEFRFKAEWCKAKYALTLPLDRAIAGQKVSDVEIQISLGIKIRELVRKARKEISGVVVSLFEKNMKTWR